MAADGIHATMQLLCNSQVDLVVHYAAHLLGNIAARSPANELAAAGAIPRLVGQLDSADAGQQLAASTGLCYLTAIHLPNSNSQAAVQSGAVAALTRCAGSTHQAVCLRAMQALTNIYFMDESDQSVAAQASQLAAAGTVRTAIQHLGAVDGQLQAVAAGLLDNLSRHEACHDLHIKQSSRVGRYQLLVGPVPRNW